MLSVAVVAFTGFSEFFAARLLRPNPPATRPRAKPTTATLLPQVLKIFLNLSKRSEPFSALPAPLSSGVRMFGTPSSFNSSVGSSVVSSAVVASAVAASAGASIGASATGVAARASASAIKLSKPSASPLRINSAMWPFTPSSSPIESETAAKRS